MSQGTSSRMEKAANLFDRIFYYLMWLFTIFVGISTFRFILPHSRHYCLIISGIIVICAVLCMRDMLRNSIGQQGLRSGVRILSGSLILIGAVISCLYLFYSAPRLEIEQPFLNQWDVIIGVLLLMVVLGLNWYYWGGILTIVIAASILYFYFGHLFDNPTLKNQEYDLSFVISYMGMNTTEGVFVYLPDGVEKMYFLVLFSAVMIGSGMVYLVTELGKLLGKHIQGGAAFPAIIGSTLEGMVMGAAVTNVALSGRLTIPMMKRHGFTPEFAAAVEVSASTAGQIIPPVMGLAAFVMAAILNMSYVAICLIAIVPAFLYMTGVTMAVLINARRHNLPKLHDPMDLQIVFRMFPTFAIPVIIVIFLLLGFYSPNYAGFFGILAILALAPLQGKYRPSWQSMNEALKDGYEILIQLCLIFVAIGPLSQAFITSNMAGRFSSILIMVLPDSQAIILLGAMVVTLFLGMGMPTVPAYVLVALTLGHFFIMMGFKPVPSHFFIQYFAVFSAVTPPVALASMAGAKIAGGSLWKTGWEAFKLVLPAFFVPFAFMYNYELLNFPNISTPMILGIVQVMILQLFWCILMYGHFHRQLNVIDRGIVAFIVVFAVAALIRPEYYITCWIVAAAGLAWITLGEALMDRFFRRER